MSPRRARERVLRRGQEGRHRPGGREGGAAEATLCFVRHGLQEPLQEGVKEPLSESSTAKSVVIQQRSWLSPGGLLPTSTAQRYAVEETLRMAAAQGQTCTVISQLCLNRK